MLMPDLEAVVIPESNQLAQDQSHGKHYTQKMTVGPTGCRLKQEALDLVT